jgi:hypothetical protein
MQTTQQLFQVFVQRDQQLRPSRWFARESLAKRYCDEFNSQNAPAATGTGTGTSTGTAATPIATAFTATDAAEQAETGSTEGKRSAAGRSVAIYQLVEIPVHASKPQPHRPR